MVLLSTECPVQYVRGFVERARGLSLSINSSGRLFPSHAISIVPSLSSRSHPLTFSLARSNAGIHPRSTLWGSIVGSNVVARIVKTAGSSSRYVEISMPDNTDSNDTSTTRLFYSTLKSRHRKSNFSSLMISNFLTFYRNTCKAKNTKKKQLIHLCSFLVFRQCNAVRHSSADEGR